MANFIFIRDPDPVRRKFAALRARSRVAFLAHLQPELVLAPDYAVAWAAAPHAPVAHHVADAAGSTDCFLVGEPHDENGRQVTAADLARQHDLAPGQRPELNGYFASVLFDATRGVRVEADVLGVFPIYYWSSGGMLLVGSSPEMFRCHPAFERSLDLHGLAGLLLTSGLVNGRTLWRGVHRLAADHVLEATAAGQVREISPAGLAEVAPIASLEEAVTQAASLHRSFLLSALKRSSRPGLLLSGGLDSRLLAGVATEIGVRPNCLTFGRAQDLDARCATQVAHELDLPQTLCDVDPADYAGFATSSVRWEHLSGGLYAIPMGWNLSMSPPAVAMDRMICGLTLDAVIGGAKHVARSGEISFERLRIGKLGFDRARLDPLLAAPELARACEDVREELVQYHRSAAPADHLREWRMNLAHRQRFAVGACAWRYSLFSWPVMPALDRGLVRLAARLPEAVSKNRQVQTRMLITRFPRLARLELDRNYLDTSPLLGPRGSHLSNLRRRAVKLQRRCRAWLGPDPRFYVRTMEINGAGWRVVRAMAEDSRTAAQAIFRPAALAELLPHPRARVRQIEDPIIHSTPLKNTLGLMLWLRQHA